MLIYNQISSTHHSLHPHLIQFHQSTKCISLKYLLFVMLIVILPTRPCLATDNGKFIFIFILIYILVPLKFNNYHVKCLFYRHFYQFISLLIVNKLIKIEFIL